MSAEFSKNFKKNQNNNTKVKISKSYIVVDIFKIPYIGGKVSCQDVSLRSMEKPVQPWPDAIFPGNLYTVP